MNDPYKSPRIQRRTPERVSVWPFKSSLDFDRRAANKLAANLLGWMAGNEAQMLGAMPSEFQARELRIDGQAGFCSP